MLIALEQIEISNVVIEKTEYSKSEQMLLILKTKAIEKAKSQAIAMTKPLNQKVGNAIFISDLNNSVIRMLNGSVAGVTIRGSKSLSEKNEFVPADIEFAKIKIETELNAKFKLE